MTPPTIPIAIASAGWYRKPEEVPMITPPARVAFRISSITR